MEMISPFFGFSHQLAILSNMSHVRMFGCLCDGKCPWFSQVDLVKAPRQ